MENSKTLAIDISRGENNFHSHDKRINSTTQALWDFPSVCYVSKPFS